MYSSTSECFIQAGSLPENISQAWKETADCNQEENCCSPNEDHPSGNKLQIIENPLECDQCHKCFSDMTSLRSLVCDKCNKSYKSSRYLQRHEMLYKGGKLLSFACSQCDKCFAWPDEDLQRHKKTQSVRQGTKEHIKARSPTGATNVISVLLIQGFCWNIQEHIQG